MSRVNSVWWTLDQVLGKTWRSKCAILSYAVARGTRKVGGLVADMIVEFLGRALWRAYVALGTSWWPTTQGIIVEAKVTESFTWLKTARIVYRYKFQDQEFEGTDAKPFFYENSAQHHVRTHPIGKSIPVRVNPENPSISIYRAPIAVLVGSHPIGE